MLLPREYLGQVLYLVYFAVVVVVTPYEIGVAEAFERCGVNPKGRTTLT